MHTPAIAVIGVGNMGASLIAGLIKDGYPNDKIWGTDQDPMRLKQLQQTFAIHVTDDNKKAVTQADVVIFAIKPQLFASVTTELAASIQAKKPLVISIAAGITEASIQHWLQGNVAIVRAMPNTPALIGCGATALYANTFVDTEARNLAESILRAVGIVVWLENETLMDTVTALSGSGPAYFFFIMQALQEAAIQLGLPQETARILTLETALGAARMAIESGKSLSELQHNVTSPGGTTEKGISVLEENQVQTIIYQVLKAAKLRSEELAAMFAKK